MSADVPMPAREIRVSMMNRRKFVGSAAVTAAMLKNWGTTAFAQSNGLPPGIQLYAVREPLASDAPGTLKALHDIGFREVESAGAGKYTAKDFRKLIADSGLKLPSAHVAFQMDNDLKPALEEANELGVEYATSSFLRKLTDPGRTSLRNNTTQQPAMPPMGLDGFKKVAARMNEIGRQAHAAGLKYAYHNHNFEFEKLPDGSVGYDVLLKETDPALVAFEVDCGWMTAAGSNPVDYFKRYPGRFRMIHVKDFKPLSKPSIDMVGPDRPAGVELGHGFIDYKPIFAASKAAGIEHAFAEQEAPYVRPQLDSAKVSYAYLRSVAAG